MTFNDRIEYMKKAYEFGAEGYKAGKKRGGAYNKDFLDFVKSIDEETIFSRFSQRLFDEYNKGWDEANLGNWDAEKGEEIYSVDSGKKVAVEEYDDDFTFKKIYGADIEYCPVCKGDLQIDEDGNLYCPECGNVEKTARKKVYHEDKKDYVLSFERDDKDYEVNGNKLTGYVTYTFGEHINGAIKANYRCDLDYVKYEEDKSEGDTYNYWGEIVRGEPYSVITDIDVSDSFDVNFEYFLDKGGEDYEKVSKKEFLEKAVVTKEELGKIEENLAEDVKEYLEEELLEKPELLPEKDEEYPAWLEEGIISGNDLRLTSSDLAKLEKELYEYLRKEWNLYPSDGTFNNARDDFSDLELTLYVDGDWKHDHLATQEAVKEFCDKANLAIINHEEVEIGESDSDSYEAKHTWKLAFDEDDKRVSNKIAGFKKMLEGIDISSTGVSRLPLYAVKGEIAKFNKEAEKFPYWVIKTSKWYDPEGLNISDKDYKIQFAGTKEECFRKLSEIKDKAKLDSDNDIEKEGDNFVTVYYPRAISKATFTVVPNMKNSKTEAIEKQPDTVYKGITIEHFPYSVKYGDEEWDVGGYVITAGSEWEGLFMRAPLYCEDEDGDVVNFKTLQQVKDYIDKYIVPEKGEYIFKGNAELHFVPEVAG